MRSIGFLAFVTITLCAIAASAGPNDVYLNGLIEPDGNRFAARNGDFGLLSRELAVIFTPSPLQPAETTGQSGFDFGVDYTLHDINETGAYWVNGVQGQLQNRQLLGVMQTLGVRGRKGFILPIPLTSEVEFGAQWMTDSSLFSLSANGRVALNEGFQYFPDIAITAGVNTMVGSEQMTLVTVPVGGSISYGFGIAGDFNLAPYLSYQAIFYNAASGVIDPDPLNGENSADNIVFDEVKLSNTANRIDRVSFGARIHVAILQITAGMDINLLPGGQSMNQYALRAGFYF